MTAPNLTCAAFEELLPGWLEGDLDVSSTADAELHLASCAPCRDLAADLRRITGDAAALPVLSPSTDLWPGIAARIETPVVALPAPRRRSVWQLGAIAATLVAATALGTWQVARRTQPAASPVTTGPTATATPTPVTAPVAAPPLTAPSAVPVSAGPRAERPEARVTYAEEIGKLQALLATHANDLDPATVAIIESSIATIDSAIVEAQAALDRDPASRFLEAQLHKSLERKLGLLRRAALLASST